MPVAATAILACVAALCGGSDDLIEKIRAHVAADLERLPNYTCRQTIERFFRPLESTKFEKLDTVRVEVALIGNKELYAWPGSARFEETSIDQLITGQGAIGSGMFALHLRNLFVNPGPEFTRRGETDLDGIRAVRFDFEVPLQRSQYFFGDRANSARVGYRGSFWAGASILDLLRLEIHVDEVPPPIEIKSGSNKMDYARVRLGDSDFLLPKSAEMSMLTSGGEWMNRTRFDGCRHYVGESVLSFGDIATSAETTKAVQDVVFPRGALVDMVLQTPIDCDKSAIGDPLEAALLRPVKTLPHGTALPKGAVFRGRVTRVENRRARARTEYCVIGLTLGAGEAPGIRAAFSGTLEAAGISATRAYYVPFSGLGQANIGMWSSVPNETAPPRPNEGVFYIRGAKPRITAGFRLLWRTNSR